MNKLKQLAGQTAVYGFSSILGRFLNYLLVPLHTWYLPEHQYGVVTEMYAYVVFILILLTFGMETTFFRFAGKNNSFLPVFHAALVPVILLSTGFLLVVHTAITPIAQAMQYDNHPEYIIWFAWIIALDAISAIAFAKLRHENRAWRFAWLKIFTIGINIFINLLFFLIIPFIQNHFQWFTGFESIQVRYVFIANLVASAGTLILLLREFHFRQWTYRPALIRQMIIYAAPLVIAGLAGMINETLDRILLKHLLSIPDHIANAKQYVQAQIGIYGANYKLSILMTLFIQTFRYAAEPFIFSQAGNKQSPQLYAYIMKMFVIAGLLIFMGVIFYMDIIKLFIGPAYHKGLHIVPVLLLANLLLGINYNLAFWYKLTNKTQFGAYVAICGAIVTIVANVLFIPIWGYEGAAWATLLSYMTMVILNYFLGRIHYPIPYPLKTIAAYGLLSALLFAIHYLVDVGNNLINYGLRAGLIIIFVLIVFRREKSRFKTLDL